MFATLERYNIYAVLTVNYLDFKVFLPDGLHFHTALSDGLEQFLTTKQGLFREERDRMLHHAKQIQMPSKHTKTTLSQKREK